MVADVTAYNVGLFIHVLAVVLAFGPTFGYGIFIGFAETKAPNAVPAVLKAVNLTNRYLVTLAMVIQTGKNCLTGLMPLLLFAAAFVLNGLLRWPLPVVLAILAPISLIWAWPKERPA